MANYSAHLKLKVQAEKKLAITLENSIKSGHENKNYRLLTSEINAPREGDVIIDMFKTYLKHKITKQNQAVKNH
jgi:hypothetical protein